MLSHAPRQATVWLILGVRHDMKDQELLRLRACELAEEIRLGKWSHVKQIDRQPVPACEEIVTELKRRCPGFDHGSYQRAIADGLFETR